MRKLILFTNTLVTLTFAVFIILQIFIALTNGFSYLIIFILILDGILVIPAMALFNYIEEKLYYRNYFLVIIVKITIFVLISIVSYVMTFYIKYILFINSIT